MRHPYYNRRKHNTEAFGNIHTPLPLAEYLFECFRLDLCNTYGVKKVSVLDPCCGRGNLCVPWKRFGHKTTGYDVIDHGNHRAGVDKFGLMDYFDLGIVRNVDAVIINPPFSPKVTYDTVSMMQPEAFLRHTHKLLPGYPVMMIVPIGFRCNQRLTSRRTEWLREEDSPNLTGLISLPLDVFRGVQIHSEVLFFNTEPEYFHRWLPDDIKERLLK